MNGVYRTLASLGLWLGVIAIVLGVIVMVTDREIAFDLTPRGFLNGAVALLLLSIAAHFESPDTGA